MKAVKKSKLFERVWEKGWPGHKKAQMMRMSSLPFSHKLAWLEEMHVLLVKLGDKRKDQSFKSKACS